MMLFTLVFELMQILLSKYRIGRWILPAITFIISITAFCKTNQIGFLIIYNIPTLMFIVTNIKMVNSGFVIDESLIFLIVVIFIVGLFLEGIVGIIIFQNSGSAVAKLFNTLVAVS